MGCNTSKESVQPVEGEEKGEEKIEVGEKVVGKVEAESPIAASEEVEKNSIKEPTPNSKPPSGTTLKALTPTSESARSGERLSNHLAATTPEPPPLDDEEEESAEAPTVNGVTTCEEEAAATKIQAIFRGHQTRRTMKQAQQPQQEPEPTREQLEAEFRADDVELCKAATTIQNSFRSHLKTKQVEGGKDEKSGSAAKEENKEEEEELDIDLTDPDLNKAATKIQASFRGHKVRKETDVNASTH